MIKVYVHCGVVHIQCGIWDELVLELWEAQVKESGSQRNLGNFHVCV